jgi:hypothetical protein
MNCPKYAATVCTSLSVAGGRIAGATKKAGRISM